MSVGTVTLLVDGQEKYSITIPKSLLLGPADELGVTLEKWASWIKTKHV